MTITFKDVLKREMRREARRGSNPLRRYLAIQAHPSHHVCCLCHRGGPTFGIYVSDAEGNVAEPRATNAVCRLCILVLHEQTTPLFRESSADRPERIAATWHSKEHDLPVVVIGEAGEHEGRRYVSIEGSATAVPEDELEYAPGMGLAQSYASDGGGTPASEMGQETNV